MLTLEEIEQIEFEIVKQKYYNANKVNAKLEELKETVRALFAEVERLRGETESADARAEIGKAMLSAQQSAAATIGDAKVKAAEILAEARTEARRIVDSAESGRVSTVGFSEAQLDTIDDLTHQLDSLRTSQATQILRIQQQLMNLVLGK